MNQLKPPSPSIGALLCGDLRWRTCIRRSHMDAAHTPQDWTRDKPTRTQAFYVHQPWNLSGRTTINMYTPHVALVRHFVWRMGKQSNIVAVSTKQSVEEYKIKRVLMFACTSIRMVWSRSSSLANATKLRSSCCRDKKSGSSSQCAQALFPCKLTYTSGWY